MVTIEQSQNFTGIYVVFFGIIETLADDVDVLLECVGEDYYFENPMPETLFILTVLLFPYNTV